MPLLRNKHKSIVYCGLEKAYYSVKDTGASTTPHHIIYEFYLHIVTTISATSIVVVYTYTGIYNFALICMHIGIHTTCHKVCFNKICALVTSSAP